MSLSRTLDDLLKAISPEAIIVSRSAENGSYFVFAEDRRQNGKAFERVGIADTLDKAAATCLERWNRATPAEVWQDPE